MQASEKLQLPEHLPSMTALLKSPEVQAWVAEHGRPLVSACLREVLSEARQRILAAAASPSPTLETLLAAAGSRLQRATRPRVRHAINATGIILHTGLGRAVFPACVVDSLDAALRGYSTLAVDVTTGERAERDELVEPVLRELTGAEAATVVNNNAAATLLVLAALAPRREVLVSRGQLIEIGGSFRLPEVMAQSGAILVEVGATNRTHLRDYERALTPNTAAILRVHPSNYRVVGFTSEVPLGDLVTLAHGRGLPVIDDLGAGALVDLKPYGLPPEPTVRSSIEAGADVVLFSGDKLIGASQSGILVGRQAVVDVLRKHPLMRALRVDKTCLMILERTLALFRKPETLAQHHPTYRMLATSLPTLRARGEQLLARLAALAPRLRAELGESRAYLGSGSLPTEAIPSLELQVAVPGTSADELGRRLRTDRACVFSRIEDDRVRLDLRTVSDAEVGPLAEALARVAA